MSRSGFGLLVFYFVLAVLIATALGSSAQTQVNIAALAGLGVEVPYRQRIAMFLHDLGSFTPYYGTMVAAAFVVALPVAALLARWTPRIRWLWFLAAGAVGLLVAFVVANAVLPMPTFIAATRGVGGMIAMLATAAVGSWAFGMMLRGRPEPAYA